MKIILISATLVIIFTLILCNKENLVGVSPAQSSANISIELAMKTTDSTITRIEGILTRQGYDTLFTNFIISNGTATGSFINVPSGLWHLKVNAYDASNSLKYSGEADVEVFPGETTPVSLTLNPATGSIIISVSWGNGERNLISNPSFEFNGQPSLTGWTINDTIWAKTVPGAPAGEGSWSLWLAPEFGPMPGGEAETIVTGESGNFVYQLSFWERNFGALFSGIITINQFRENDIIFSTNISANASFWTLFSKSIKLSLLQTDTLKIILRSVSPILKAGNFSKLDTVSTGVMFDGISLIKNQ